MNEQHAAVALHLHSTEASFLAPFVLYSEHTRIYGLNYAVYFHSAAFCFLTNLLWRGTAVTHNVLSLYDRQNWLSVFTDPWEKNYMLEKHNHLVSLAC